MKQLTVYDAIRTHARDVVRWQVREALELAMRKLTVSGGPHGWTPQDREARALRDEMKQRTYQRASRRNRRLLAELQANIRKAVLELRGDRLRVIQGGKQ